MAKDSLFDVTSRSYYQELGKQALETLARSGEVSKSQYRKFNESSTLQQEMGYLMQHLSPSEAFEALKKDNVRVLWPNEPVEDGMSLYNPVTKEAMEVQIIEPRFSDSDTTFTALLVLGKPGERKTKGKSGKSRR